MSVTFIHIVGYTGSLIVITKFHYINVLVCFPIYLWIYTGCFKFGAIMNLAAINILSKSLVDVSIALDKDIVAALLGY